MNFSALYFDFWRVGINEWRCNRRINQRYTFVSRNIHISIFHVVVVVVFHSFFFSSIEIHLFRLQSIRMKRVQRQLYSISFTPTITLQYAYHCCFSCPWDWFIDNLHTCIQLITRSYTYASWIATRAEG